jgi:hypothetical protein
LLLNNSSASFTFSLIAVLYKASQAFFIQVQVYQIGAVIHLAQTATHLPIACHHLISHFSIVGATVLVQAHHKA